MSTQICLKSPGILRKPRRALLPMWHGASGTVHRPVHGSAHVEFKKQLGLLAVLDFFLPGGVQRVGLN